MRWPDLSAWSDPAVTDPVLLERLGAVHPHVALGVCANPNLPADAVMRLLPSIKLGVESCRKLERYTMPRLNVDQQVTVVLAAHHKADRCTEEILPGCHDETLLTLNTVLENPATRRPQALRRRLSEAISERIYHRHRWAEPISDALAEAVAVVGAPHWNARTFFDAVVTAWQPRDVDRMTQILLTERDRHPASAANHATLGVPGLADTWFDLGGLFRRTACEDPSIDVDQVTAWLEVADPDEESGALEAAIGNPRVPVAALRDLMCRLEQLRWPADGAPVGADRIRAIKNVGYALDRRMACTPLQVDVPLDGVEDAGQLAALTAGIVTEPVLSGLVRNPRLTVSQLLTLLLGARDRWRELSPATRTGVLAAGDKAISDPTLSSAERTQVESALAKLTKAQPVGQQRQPAAAARDHMEASTRRHQETVADLLARTEEATGPAVVHFVAPLLADQLRTVEAWVDLYQRADARTGATFTGLLNESVASQNAAVTSQALTALLGNPLGDD